MPLLGRRIRPFPNFHTHGIQSRECRYVVASQKWSCLGNADVLFQFPHFYVRKNQGSGTTGSCGQSLLGRNNLLKISRTPTKSI